MRKIEVLPTGEDDVYCIVICDNWVELKHRVAYEGLQQEMRIKHAMRGVQ